MKLILISLLITFSVSSSIAQATITPSRVPETVKKKFDEKYPDAKGLLWKQSDPGFVEATFTNEDRKCSSIFLASGGWVSTDCEITEAEMPEAARTFLGKPENADKVTKYYRSDTKAKGLQFSAVVKKDGKGLEYIFNDEGSLIMKGPKK